MGGGAAGEVAAEVKRYAQLSAGCAAWEGIDADVVVGGAGTGVEAGRKLPACRVPSSLSLLRESSPAMAI
jgi:hypothetical protein